jgi:hypothetical protein
MREHRRANDRASARRPAGHASIDGWLRGAAKIVKACVELGRERQQPEIHAWAEEDIDAGAGIRVVVPTASL